MGDRVYLYDSTLRDGAQTNGVDFNAVDKQDIAHKLDEIGIDYVEGGWPGANPTDDAFFQNPPKLENAHISAFGMTRRPNTSAKNDPGLSAILNSSANHVCLVGKSWDFHVTHALETTLEENLNMIAESIEHASKQKEEVLFDAEHFFDGYKANPEYALKVIEAAYKNGARWVVLCDTNGGSLPHEIEAIIAKAIEVVPGDHLGIHCHNDTGNAVANSLAAVRAGVRQIQGTINGIGERCGNANLISIIPTLTLKMGYELGIDQGKLAHLTKLSRFLDDKLNKQSDPFAPYVGSSAFAHKGGLHVSAVAKYAHSYEHITPETIGNSRDILVSDQAGRANIIARLEEIGFSAEKYDKETIAALISKIKQQESQGYAYDNADASFELLARNSLEEVPHFFKLENFRVIDERRWNAKEQLITLSEATVRVEVKGTSVMTVAEGNGPVNALDQALRKALAEQYPAVKDIALIDYKVRIINSGTGTGAVTRVLIETEDLSTQKRWNTIGVSSNIIDASYNALRDSIIYKLMQ
jgi:2-isopropylmalate synthase